MTKFNSQSDRKPVDNTHGDTMFLHLTDEEYRELGVKLKAMNDLLEKMVAEKKSSNLPKGR